MYLVCKQVSKLPMNFKKLQNVLYPFKPLYLYVKNEENFNVFLTPETEHR